MLSVLRFMAMLLLSGRAWHHRPNGATLPNEAGRTPLRTHAAEGARRAPHRHQAKVAGAPGTALLACLGMHRPQPARRTDPMATITELPAVLQALLGTVAEQAARHTGCVQRQRPGTFGGATLVQTLVLGWLADPDAPLTGLCRAAARVGVAVTPQALDQRFTPALAACLQRVLVAALTEVGTTEPAVAPLLARFTAIALLDSTTIALPDALAEVWQGCGGRVPQGSAAALKL